VNLNTNWYTDLKNTCTCTFIRLPIFLTLSHTRISVHLATEGHCTQIHNHVSNLSQIPKRIFFKKIFNRKIIYPEKGSDIGLVEDQRVGAK
jgi:hypothetical protein